MPEDDKKRQKSCGKMGKEKSVQPGEYQIAETTI